MKALLLLAFLLFSTSPSFAQNEKPSLKITSDVKEIAMQEIYPNTKSAFYITYIKLNLKLTNTSPVPLIFLSPKPASLSYATIIQPEKTGEIFLAAPMLVSSSFLMMKKDWEKLKTELDKPLPPEKQTLIVIS